MNPNQDALSGKWVWIWNWRRCDGGDPAKVAVRLRDAGSRGVLVVARLPRRHHLYDRAEVLFWHI